MVENTIADVIVAFSAISSSTTDQGMVAEFVHGAATKWAFIILFRQRNTKPSQDAGSEKKWIDVGVVGNGRRSMKPAAGSRSTGKLEVGPQS